MITVDTNILVYAVDSDAGARHVAAKDLLLRAAGNAALSLQCLVEFYRVATRRYGHDPRAVRRRVAASMAHFDVFAATPASLLSAIDAVDDHRLSFWDAMLWAAARDAGCTLLLSEDGQDGRVIDGVRIVNPFDPANARTIDALLPPRR
jgi:predicted nucleic acid-binding protein